MRGLIRNCRGTTTVEFALCAPILFLFTFTSFEYSRVNSLRQTAENAVYEGCRRGIVPGATVEDVQASTQLVLDSVFTQNPTITVTPSVITEDTSEVTVDVTIPLDANSWVAPNFFRGRQVTSSLTLARERGLNSSVD
ncbi:pilus assembly protein [Aeoliella sp. ICT_H6.2]|uniref:Pilus assembly protein n=1 Tax=Aeoliella straminimaris TaxID=2954799 RepID=A0A9X2JF90_9BACT|nr:TadE/TadG family type IV pilus assembly protein [Aeoliella straminimaris]MCO6043451.1 pilus assembly protein [Aeoliella straminimaris]